MSEPVRVLTLVDNSGELGGGAERLAVQIATGLDRERFAPWLCVSRGQPGAAVRETLRAAGVPLLALDRQRTTDVWPWRRLAALLRQERIDVLHTHKFGSNVWGAIIGRATRTPVVVAHEHTWSFEGQRLRRALDRHLVARAADAIVAVSRQDRDKMIALEGIPPERIRVIPTAVAVDAPSHGADVRAELGIPPEAPVVVNVAGLRAQKAHDVLIEATALLAERLPDARVIVAGDGPERSRLEALVSARGLDRRFLLLGKRDDVPDILRAADVVALSSDYEGMPLAALEAMAAGRPLVATAVGALPDVVEDGVTGVLVAPRDPAALADALARVAGDRSLARTMGDAARRRAHENYDLRASVRRYEELYVELLSARRETASNAGPSASSSHSSLE